MCPEKLKAQGDYHVQGHVHSTLEDSQQPKSILGLIWLGLVTRSIYW